MAAAASESSDRHNQKRRTRKDLLQAASRLMKLGQSMQPSRSQDAMDERASWVTVHASA